MLKSTRWSRLAFQRGLRHALSPHTTFQVPINYMATRRPSKTTSETEANSTAWEQVGMDVEDIEESSEAEVVTGTTQRHPKNPGKIKVRKNQPGRTPSLRRPRHITVEQVVNPSAASGSNQVNMNMEQMTQMLQLMRQQGLLPELPVEEASGEAPKTPRASNKEVNKEVKEKKAGKRQETAALTGSKADFPTLSTEFSDDVTFNVMNSLRSQSLVFKWKLLLLLLRVKVAVEDPAATTRRRWKRNPRWIMHMHGRHLAALWGHLGAARQLCCRESQDVLVGSNRDDSGEGTPEEELKPSDPNAPTVREQARRGRDRVDLVLGGEELHPGQEEGDAEQGGDLHELSGSDDGDGGVPEVYQQDDLGQEGLPGNQRKITLNRRQRRSILQGVKRGIQTHRRIYEVAAAQPHPWTLLEVFAGCANLTKVANLRERWNVLPAQDIKYGLDLTLEEHQKLLKDMIEQQRPDVISLSPPCGPWSTWQRMRKKKGVLRELRRQHMPFWRFVVWVWAFQSQHGGVVILEQPQQSEALKLNVMHERKGVWQKDIHLCGLGLRDKVSGMPHKKPTAIQMNHPVIENFPDVICQHQPGQHQPIEGSVRIQRDGRQVTMKRSTLAGEWTTPFCKWMLDGIERALEEAAHTCHVAITDPTPNNRIWETVPVEVEDTPEGQLRQQLALHDYDTKYDYISFAGTAALLSKRMRSTLAHLHVALGHTSNERLARMMAQNGAKDEVLEAIKQLKCQICMQVQSPQATPKASFTRPMGFNERLVSDTFYVWDTNGHKFAVTHAMDAFSMYMVAVAAKDAAALTTVELLRDKWFSVFGPPSILMTDQGPEYRGVVEQLMRTFGVFHDMVPPTAHWRMALSERHGAVIKLLIMKIIKETTAIGLDDLQTAVTAAISARNRQARVGGFSPVQLVFGKDTSIPSHLMEALSGQFKFQLSTPTTIEDSFRRSADMRKAATDAFQWLEANEALRRAAGSRARLPRLELLTEGAQVMFWEPPPHRRGLAKRLQDQVSWVGPAVVASVERFDGSIKRVWVRYRHKLKGLPLEYVRLAVAEEQEASTVVAEALQDLEKQLQEGRVNAEDTPQAGLDAPEHPEIPPKIDPNFPERHMSDDAFEDDDDEDFTEEAARKATSVLDDVPISIHQRHRAAPATAANQPPPKRPKVHLEPSKMTFGQKRDMYEQAARQTKNHLSAMRKKLQRHRPPVSESDYSEILHTDHGGREDSNKSTRSEADSWASEEMVGTSPPYVEPMDFTEETAENNQRMRWALLASIKDVTEYMDPIEDSVEERLTAVNPRRSETARQEGILLTDERLLPEGVQARISSLPATPMTRATTPHPLHLKSLMPWASDPFLTGGWRQLSKSRLWSSNGNNRHQPQTIGCIIHNVGNWYECTSNHGYWCSTHSCSTGPTPSTRLSWRSRCRWSQAKMVQLMRRGSPGCATHRWFICTTQWHHTEQQPHQLRLPAQTTLPVRRRRWVYMIGWWIMYFGRDGTLDNIWGQSGRAWPDLKWGPHQMYRLHLWLHGWRHGILPKSCGDRGKSKWSGTRCVWGKQIGWTQKVPNPLRRSLPCQFLNGKSIGQKLHRSWCDRRARWPSSSTTLRMRSHWMLQSLTLSTVEFRSWPWSTMKPRMWTNQRLASWGWSWSGPIWLQDGKRLLRSRFWRRFASTSPTMLSDRSAMRRWSTSRRSYPAGLFWWTRQTHEMSTPRMTNYQMRSWKPGGSLQDIEINELVSMRRNLLRRRCLDTTFYACWRRSGHGQWCSQMCPRHFYKVMYYRKIVESSCNVPATTRSLFASSCRQKFPMDTKQTFSVFARPGLAWLRAPDCGTRSSSGILSPLGGRSGVWCQGCSAFSMKHKRSMRCWQCTWTMSDWSCDLRTRRSWRQSSMDCSALVSGTGLANGLGFVVAMRGSMRTVLCRSRWMSMPRDWWIRRWELQGTGRRPWCRMRRSGSERSVVNSIGWQGSVGQISPSEFLGCNSWLVWMTLQRWWNSKS